LFDQVVIGPISIFILTRCDNFEAGYIHPVVALRTVVSDEAVTGTAKARNMLGPSSTLRTQLLMAFFLPYNGHSFIGIEYAFIVSYYDQLAFSGEQLRLNVGVHIFTFPVTSSALNKSNPSSGIKFSIPKSSLSTDKWHRVDYEQIVHAI
jgi:hypothetical protein